VRRRGELPSWWDAKAAAAFQAAVVWHMSAGSLFSNAVAQARHAMGLPPVKLGYREDPR
jgi:hypothetical protein